MKTIKESVILLYIIFFTQDAVAVGCLDPLKNEPFPCVKSFFRLKKLNLERLTVRLGLTVIHFPIFRQARPDFFRRSKGELQFLQVFAFADQILPSSGTFDLSVRPFSLSKVFPFGNENMDGMAAVKLHI